MSKFQKIIDRLPDPPDDRPRFYLASSIFLEDDHPWTDHILELDNKIAELAPDYVLEQVKEKFGGLRYYIDFDSVPDEHEDTVEEIITAYEYASLDW